MDAAIFIINIFFALLNEFNFGFWPMNDSDNSYRPVPCDIKWRVYKTCTKLVEFTEHCVEDGLQMFESKFFNKNTPEIVLYSNPFYGNFAGENIKPMIEALSSRCDFNLIALDNTIHTDVGLLTYAWTVYQVYKDSLRYAEILNKAIDLGLISPKYVTALGYSLGGQISGHVCRNLHGKCGSILAVDPAGPLYNPKQISKIDFYPHFQLVSRSDACQVVFLQCNRWMLGSGHNAAHINIAVNGGLFQPSCFFGDILCSHNFCNTLVIHAIRNPGNCVATSLQTEKSEVFFLKVPLDKGNGQCNSKHKQLFNLKTFKGPQCFRKSRLKSFQHTIYNT